MLQVLFFAIIVFWLFAGSLDFVKKNFKKSRQKIDFEESKFIIALLAKVAKSDGRVNEKEAYLITQIIDDCIRKIKGTRKQRQELIQIYKIEKENIENAKIIANQYFKTLNLKLETRIDRVYFFVNMAFVDGNFSDYERQVIQQICDGFGLPLNIQIEIFSQFSYENQSKENNKEQNYYHFNNTQNEKTPYEILGVSKNDDFKNIKKKYRELVKKYHPDILIGKGADENIIKQSTKKLQEINEAYEKIKKEKDR